MPDGAHKGSFLQAYNAQAAVDSAAQIIVAAEITQQSNDKQQLVPMLQQVIDNVHGKPQVASADTGYWSAANVTAESLQGIDLHVATERQPHGESKDVPVDGLPEGSALFQQMRDKLKTEAGKAVYKMRKQIVEPVFGYIKEGRGFRRFSFRGLGNVRSEWRLICATHNLLKLFRSGWKMQLSSS
jgi:transcriptional regulator of acetoin/glycerol metabolism